MTLTLTDAPAQRDAARERRRFERQEIERSCKIYRPAHKRYLPGRTLDLSAGGALLEVEAPRPLIPGEAIDLAVAWTNLPVLPTRALQDARIVRVTRERDGRQIVAVEFKRAQSLSAVA